jgi:hypothetical protein
MTVAALVVVVNSFVNIFDSCCCSSPVVRGAVHGWSKVMVAATVLATVMTEQVRGRLLGARGLGQLHCDRPAQQTEVLVREPHVQDLACPLHVAKKCAMCTWLHTYIGLGSSSTNDARHVACCWLHATVQAACCSLHAAQHMLHGARCASSNQSSNNYLVGASLQVHGDVSSLAAFML